jgi:prefoldin subunit 4
MELEEGARADVVVRLEDQKEICEFGKLNARRNELREEVADAEKRLGELEDAEEAVMLADESEPGAFKLRVGECFVESDSGAAVAYVAAALEADRAARDRATAELASISARQEVLKAKLYSRFGKSINLEDGEKK